MMNIIKGGVLLLGLVGVAGCVSVRPSTGSGNEVVAIGEDRGFDRGSLSQLESGIYIDPDGCHIWMIDDGLEGYWSRRRDPVSGLPVCTDVAPPNSIVGDFRSGSNFRDWVPN